MKSFRTSFVVRAAAVAVVVVVGLADEALAAQSADKRPSPPSQVKMIGSFRLPVTKLKHNPGKERKEEGSFKEMKPIISNVLKTIEMIFYA